MQVQGFGFQTGNSKIQIVCKSPIPSRHGGADGIERAMQAPGRCIASPFKRNGRRDLKVPEPASLRLVSLTDDPQTRAKRSGCIKQGIADTANTQMAHSPRISTPSHPRAPPAVRPLSPDATTNDIDLVSARRKTASGQTIFASYTRMCRAWNARRRVRATWRSAYLHDDLYQWRNSVLFLFMGPPKAPARS